MSVFNPELLRRTKGFYSSERTPSFKKKDEKEIELDNIIKLHKSAAGKATGDEDDGSEEWEQVFGRSYPSSISSAVTGDIHDDLKRLLQMFSDNGIRVKMTSGYREGAVTSNGRPSNHSIGEAIDVVPEDGDFETLKLAIKTNPEISQYMQSLGYGIIDESTQEMLARTGGSGPHLHIGKDKLGQTFWNDDK